MWYDATSLYRTSDQNTQISLEEEEDTVIETGGK
jgi:hypothetical protein